MSFHLDNSLVTDRKDFLQKLECPLCMKALKPPFFMCKFGHSFCNVCISKMFKCCFCYSSITNSTNYGIKLTAECLKLSCAHKGCQSTISLKDMSKHYEECQYREYSCPEFRCLWSGRLNKLFHHLRNTHSPNMSSWELTHKLSQSSGRYYISYYSYYLFMIDVNVKKSIQITCQLIGPSTQVSNYYVEIACKGKYPEETVRITKRCEPFGSEKFVEISLHTLMEINADAVVIFVNKKL